MSELSHYPAMCITGKEDQRFYDLVERVRQVLASRFSPRACDTAFENLDYALREFDRAADRGRALDSLLARGDEPDAATT